LQLLSNVVNTLAMGLHSTLWGGVCVGNDTDEVCENLLICAEKAAQQADSEGEDDYDTEM